MNFEKPVLYLFAVLFMASCEQFLEVDLPGQEPRLVLNALLEPSDTLKVFLTKSRGILEGREFDDFELVKDANVNLRTQDGQMFPLGFIDRSNPFETNAFYFISGHDFKVNETYELVAEHNAYREIRSTQRLPAKILIKSVEMVRLGPRAEYEGDDEFEITVKFEDPSESNFYEISGSILGEEVVVIDGEPTYFYYQTYLYPEPVNPVYEKDYRMSDVLLFDDALLNGSDAEMVFRTYIPRHMDMEVTIRLAHVSESYYKYQDMADLQRYSSGDFLSQPVLVYNNISNGFGIFKSRNTDLQIIQVAKED